MHTFSLKAQLVNKKFNLSPTEEEKFIDYSQIKVQFCIDGMEILTFKSHVGFFDLLEPVPQGESERYFLTCECGIAECAGFDPFTLIREDNKLTVIVPNQRTFAPMNGLDYVLNAQEFEQAQMDLMRYISFHTSLGVYLYEPYAENEMEVMDGEQDEFILSPAQHVNFIENFKTFNELTQSPAVKFF